MKPGSSGADTVPVWFYLYCSYELAEVVAHVVNTSIQGLSHSSGGLLLLFQSQKSQNLHRLEIIGQLLSLLFCRALLKGGWHQTGFSQPFPQRTYRISLDSVLLVAQYQH